MDNNTSPVATLLQKQIDAGKTPGLYHAFFDAEKILFDFSGGMADLNTGLPAGASVAFHGYSVTKLFTATAVMQLIGRGQLQPDAPARQYLPGFAYSPDITVRHLLAHSSGLPNPLPIGWIHTAEEHDSFDEKAFFNAVFQKHTRLRFSPGEKFSYSNLGYIILGQLIENVSGMSYTDYIARHIFEPLGIGGRIGFGPMANAATGYHKALSFGNLLLGFLLDKKRFMGESTGGWKPFLPAFVNGAAYGGLVGTPEAFIAFAQALLTPADTLLAPSLRREMWQENRLASGRLSGMSLGWFTGRLRGHDYVCHAGGGGGFYCELRLYPQLNRGSVLFCNRSGFSDERLLDRIDAGHIPNG